MTAKELTKFVGKTGRWKTQGVEIEVTITDARLMFGRIDVLITPVAGKGEAWVDCQFVGIID